MWALLLLGLIAGLVFLGRTAPRSGGGLWRPGAGMLALFALLAGLAFAVRGGWIIGASLAALAAALAYAARNRPSPDIDPGMDEDRARAVLGVGPRANRAEILAAHRKKVMEAHPDRGGSHARASELNAARDRLLRPRP